MFKVDIEDVTNTNQSDILAQDNALNEDTQKEEVIDNNSVVKDETLSSEQVPDENNNDQEIEAKEGEQPAEKKEEKPENNKYWLKLKKERAEKKELAEHLEQLRQEKLQMEQMLHQAINSGSTHYKNTMTRDLESAQARLQMALESGDGASVAKATADISKATHALGEADKITNFPENKNSEEYANQERTKEYENRLYRWLENNPEVDRNAPEYDEKIAGQVLSFIRKLDRKYETNNKGQLIGSSGYYSMIDEYIDNVTAQGSSLAPSPAKHFGAVRSRSPMESAPERKQRELTLQEKKAALSFGMTDERYLKELANYPKEMRLK
jgi:hypothetical protein